MAKLYMTLIQINERLSFSVLPEVLDEIKELAVVSEVLIKNDEALKNWAKDLEIALNKKTLNSVEYFIAVEKDTEENNRISINKQVFGISNITYLEQGFFESGDYEYISKYIEQVSEVVDNSAVITRGEKRLEVTRFDQAYDWLMKEAKRGQNIQRYKGLGEMNPEQLWETTMDPDVRRLLQVRIEDAVKADEVFTTLMGDQVEPRREFIEANAGKVGNLDI